MTPTELASKCVEQGFIPADFKDFAISEFSIAFEKKGEEETVAKIMGRMRRSPISSGVVLKMILEELPDKPKPAPKPTDEPISIETEIIEEDKDKAQFEEMFSDMAEVSGKRKGFSEPNDPKWDKPPSVFIGGPYEGHPEYKQHTWISVYRESRERKTSMHQICRERGLHYGYLLA